MSDNNMTVTDLENQWREQFERHVEGVPILEARRQLERVVQGEYRMPSFLLVKADIGSVEAGTDALFNLTAEIAAAAKESGVMVPGLVPVMVALISASRASEEHQKLCQAYGLHALFYSGIWRPFADESDGEPSWKSFVEQWLSGMGHSTTVNRVRTIEVFGVKAKWSMEKLARVGLSKLTAARAFVEQQIDSGGIEPETERVLEESTFDGVLQYMATQRKGTDHVVSVFVSEAGIIRLEYDGLYYDLGTLRLIPPEGVGHVEWDEIIGLALRGLRQALASVHPKGLFGEQGSSVEIGMMAEPKVITLR